MTRFAPVEVNADVIALLAQAGLPTEDLADGKVSLIGMWDGGVLGAVVGMELHGRVALLRSLVVSPPLRGRGHGEALVEKAEALARQAGVESVYLLTVASSAFFQRCGFTGIGREQVPVAIRQTPQFSSLCPASCAVMRKQL